ncbi:MAG: aminopeptidase [Deltaproteobacteria bacterium]|nr:MAG: aminopeptidase [Deltaproteobacteria bacterium]
MRRVVRTLIAAAVAVVAACGGALGAPDRTAPPANAGALAAAYRDFLDAGRTPADIVAWTTTRSPGWRRIDPLATKAARVAPGDRLVFVDRDRTALFVVVGRRPLAGAGARLVCGHIDTPAPRLRADALVDDAGEARLVTYRYGGARRHHWLGIPLGLVGRVATAGGDEVAVRLGFAGDGFSFYATDERDGSAVAIAASTHAAKETPSHTFARELYRRYGITAADLATAELYLVPAWPARDVGVDRAFVGAHGQDDRLNSFAAWRALIDAAGDEPPERTMVAWLVDREEIGSTGPTGARSRFLDTVFSWLLRAEGAADDERTLARAFAASAALSADTPAALNPNFPEPHVARLAPRLGGGPVLFPYAGRRGKQGSHLARAERIREVVDLFASAGAPLQVAELGKVDAGGGGTISKYLAERGIDVVDVGIPVVSMHSPLELSAKADLWHGYRAFRAWLRGAAQAH